MKFFPGKLFQIILIIIISLMTLISCGYDDSLFERPEDKTESIIYQELEGVPAPDVMFIDAFGNELLINTTADLAGAYIRLIRGPGIEEYWNMQYKLRFLAIVSRKWEPWGEWIVYDDSNRPQIGETGEYEIQVRYADPFTDPNNPPLLSLSDSDLEALKFIHIEPLTRPGKYISDGDVVDDDVRASLPDKTYLTIEGEELTPEIWIMKESTGTIYKSNDFLILEVLEGYVNTYKAHVLYYSEDEIVVSESSILTFTIDKQRPGRINILYSAFSDEGGYQIPPGTRTNKDVTLTIDFETEEDGLTVQYFLDGLWRDMYMQDDDTAFLNFTIPVGFELDVSSPVFRFKDAAGNTSSVGDEVIFGEGVYIDKTIPPPPDWDLKSDGIPVNQLVSSPSKLIARIPKGEKYGSYEFSYDGNGDGVFAEWKKLSIGTVQEFTGVENEVLEYTVRIRFSDTAGNISAVLEKSFIIDRELPEPPFWSLRDFNDVEIESGKRITTSAFLDVYAPEGEIEGVIQYRLRIGDLESYSPWEVLPEGAPVEFPGEDMQSKFYTLQLRFLDTAGNSSSILTREFTIDRKIPDAPDWKLQTKEDGEEVVNEASSFKPVELYPTKPDGEKIGKFEYRRKNAVEEDFSEWITLASNEVAEFDTLAQSATTYMIEIRFRDEVGNLSEAAARSFTIDKIRPATPFWNLVRYTYGVQVDSADDTINGPVRLYATIPPGETDAGFFEYHLQIREDPFFPWEVLPPGYFTSFEGAYRDSVQYRVQIRYRDPAGNISPVKQKSFMVDRDIPAPPRWKLEDVLGHLVYEDRVLNLPVYLTAQTPVDESGGTFKYSYALNGTEEFSPLVTLAIDSIKMFEGVEGDTTKFTVRIHYVDPANNISPEVERSFYIDYERPPAPVWNLVDSISAKVTDGQILLGKATLTATDPSYEADGTFQFSFDDNQDGVFTDWTTMRVGDSTSFLGKPESKVKIVLKIRYLDATGNVGVESSREFKIDLTGTAEQ